MRCLKIGHRYLIRLEKGEEVIGSLRAFVRQERIPAATLSGLGAADDVTVAFFDTETKAYRNYRRTGLIEITSLIGNVSWKGADPVVHVHVTAFHETEGALGGHLVSAVVSATVEIGVEPYERKVERVQDAAIGLPLLELPPCEPA